MHKKEQVFLNEMIPIEMGDKNCELDSPESVPIHLKVNCAYPDCGHVPYQYHRNPSI